MLHRAPSKAFTLLEALMAAILLTLVVSAALLPFTVGIQSDQAVGRRAEAIALAQALMEEILAKPFYDPQEPNRMDPGPDGHEGTRIKYDNVDDYHGHVEKPGMIAPTFLSGSIADAAATAIDPTLWRQATVEYIHLAGQDASQRPNACRVVVTVHDDSAELVRLSRVVYGDAPGG